MVREICRKPVGLAVLTGLGLSSLAASDASATLLTLDLRLPGGTKQAAAPAVGGSLTLEVWAQIQNNDNNHANDGFASGTFGVYSNEPVGGSILGDLAPMTFSSSFNGPVSNSGTAQNLDATLTDKELGGTDVNDSGPAGGGNNWVVATGYNASPPAGPITVFGAGSGGGVTEFLLGTTTWTVTGSGTLGTTLNVDLRRNTTTYIQPYSFVSDGTQYNVRWDGLTFADSTWTTTTTVPNAVGLGTAVSLVAGGGTSATWSGSGNWGVGGNWTGGTAPTNAGDTATFGTGASSVNVEAAHSVGTMNFNSATSYTLSGTGTVTLDATAGSAAINVTAGSHTISAPVVLADPTTVTTSASTGITLAQLTATGQSLTKAGAGSLTVDKFRGTSLAVNGGTVTVAANDGTALGRQNSASKAALTVSGAGSKLDLTNNSMVVLGNTAANIRGLIVGNALVTTATAPAGKTAGLGYAQGNDAGIAGLGGVLAGQSFSAADVAVKYTYFGDADLDGDVDGNDVGAWAVNFTGSGGSTTKVWTQGDWDYDGDVDGNDVGRWATNFTGSGGGVLNITNAQPEAVAMLEAMGFTVVPEPASLGLIGVAGLALARRRRK
jgi:hypothetical protein